MFAWLLACGGEPVALDGEPAHSGVACDGVAPFSTAATATTPSGVVVGFASVAPDPPDVGDNDWVLTLSDGDGPVAGAAPRLIPWMPLHGHGLVPPEYVGAETTPGTYAVPTFDLIMPGTWELTVDLAAPGDAADSVVFPLCAEG